MFPKEHGAYGQLLFPLVTALAVGHPRGAALLLSAAAVCAFLAHEPLLVLLGQRGSRAAREQRTRAAAWFGALAAAAAACGLTAIALAPADVRLALVVPAALAAVLALVILAQHEHTTFGEVLSALTLSSLALPIARAAEASMASAVTCAAVFAAAFVSATMCVRAVIAHTRRPPAAGSRAIGALVSAASVGALWTMASTGVAKAAAPWAALPVCALGCLLALAPPSARHLRTIGWALVATTTATAVLLVMMLR